jgi:hypothetical protein
LEAEGQQDFRDYFSKRLKCTSTLPFYTTVYCSVEWKDGIIERLAFWRVRLSK